MSFPWSYSILGLFPGRVELFCCTIGLPLADLCTACFLPWLCPRLCSTRKSSELLVQSSQCSLTSHRSSLILWEFCLRHPEVRDVCDIGQMIFWNQKWAWWFTAVMFLLNNTVCLPTFFRLLEVVGIPKLILA